MYIYKIIDVMLVEWVLLHYTNNVLNQLNGDVY